MSIKKTPFSYFTLHFIQLQILINLGQYERAIPSLLKVDLEFSSLMFYYPPSSSSEWVYIFICHAILSDAWFPGAAVSIPSGITLWSGVSSVRSTLHMTSSKDTECKFYFGLTCGKSYYMCIFDMTRIDYPNADTSLTKGPVVFKQSNCLKDRPIIYHRLLQNIMTKLVSSGPWQFLSTSVSMHFYSKNPCNVYHVKNH